MRSRRSGAKALDMSELREALRDDRTWTGVGLVWVPPTESSHYILSSDDCLVFTRLMPHDQPILCRLASFGGQANGGLWKIPPVGSEVVIIIPNGELESDPMIVGTLATGQVPSDLDETTYVIRNADKIVVASTNDQVQIAGNTGGTSATITVGNDGHISILCAGSGKVYVGDNNGTQPAVLGDTLETRLAEVASLLLSHTHDYIPGTSGTAQTQSPHGSTTPAVLTHANDVIKAAKVQVK